MPDDGFSPQEQQKIGAIILTLARKYAGTAAIALLTLLGSWGKGYIDRLQDRLDEAAREAMAAKNAVEVNQTISQLQLDSLKDRMSRVEHEIDTLQP